MRRASGTRHRARRTAAQWRKLIERSGETRGNYCAANGLVLSTFDLSRRKLGETQVPADEVHPESLFVELTNPTEAAGLGLRRGQERGSLSSARVWCRGCVGWRHVERTLGESNLAVHASPPTCGARSTDYRLKCGDTWVKIRRAVNGSCLSIVADSSDSARSFPLLRFDAATGPADRLADRFTRPVRLRGFPVPLARAPGEPERLRTASFVT